MKILVINPGSTSTKIAVYNDEHVILQKTIRHQAEELIHYNKVIDQYAFRKALILEQLAAEQCPLDFDAVIGRGGLLKPISSGVYEVNDRMKHDLCHATMEHACNLGALLADEIASEIPNCKAYIADPVVVDELQNVARITGSPLLPKQSIFHALNQKAVARRYAKSIRKPYEDLNLIVAHLGGGISVAAHHKGRVIDVNNALNGSGPFSPERAGTLPALQLVDLCFGGEYSKEQICKMISGKGGLMAHTGSTDVQQLVKDAATDSDKALLLAAMIYNITKEIASLPVVFPVDEIRNIDAVILTGGIAYNEYITKQITERVNFIAPVVIYPGEDEMEALAFNALMALKGEVTVKEYC